MRPPLESIKNPILLQNLAPKSILVMKNPDKSGPATIVNSQGEIQGIEEYHSF
jgi:hypothetical protein